MFFSVYNLVEDIDYYLKGVCPAYGHFGRFDGHLNGKKYAFGIDVYEHLQKYLQQENLIIYLRIFHALLKHHEYFIYLINFLFSEYYISAVKYSELKELYCKQSDYSETILNLCMKYNITKNVDLLNRISNYLKELSEQQKSFNSLKILLCSKTDTMFRYFC